MNKISKENAINNILNQCQKSNITFNGFKNEEWKGTKTKLKLTCNICGNYWETCSYDNFIRNRGCPICKRKNHFKNKDEVIEKIKEICTII